jgi:BirA family biotin operon repressor/biotin-[acetyl-CoA-carboxylase] ligase
VLFRSGNLYFSLLLKNSALSRLDASKILQISFLTIAALGLGIEEILKNQQNQRSLNDNLIRFKWPNDLLLNQKKAAGVLIESNFKQQSCDFVVVGVGINNKISPNLTSQNQTELQANRDEVFLNQNTQNPYPATCLSEIGLEIENSKLLEIFLAKFQPLYQQWLDFGFIFLRNLWLSRAHGIGTKIILKTKEESGRNFQEGIFDGIDEEGNLLLKTNDKTRKISSGEVLKSFLL